MNEITWTCDVCGEVIDPEYGALWVAMEQLRDQRAVIQWHVTHDWCAEYQDVYDIDLNRVSTFEGLAEWTERLIGKNWFWRSHWRAVLRRALKNVAAHR